MLELKSPLESIVHQVCKSIDPNNAPTRSWTSVATLSAFQTQFITELRLDADKILINQQATIEQSNSMFELLNVIRDSVILSSKILVDNSGKPVIEIGAQRNFAWNVLVAPFLREYFKHGQDGKFNKQIFDSVFDHIVSELHEATITYVITIPLLNLELTTDSVYLSPILCVRSIDVDEVNEWLNLHGMLDHPLYDLQELISLRAVAEFTYQRHPGEALDFQYYKSLNDLVALLRLITNTDIYIAFILQRTRGVLNYPGAQESIPYSLRLQGNMATVNQEKAESLVRYWKRFLTSEQGNYLALPLRRWAGRAERLNDEDKLIDYWIGLESLFTPDTSQEIKFRGSLRIAALIGETGKHRENIYADMRHSYDWRSTMVHGSDPDRIKNLQKKGSLQDITIKTGDCLRAAIMKLLESDQIIDPTKVEINLLKK